MGKLTGNMQGIALIEVLIYFGIFTSMFLVILAFVFNLLGSVRQINNNILLTQEGNFLISKINSAFLQPYSITSPALGATSTVLNMVANSAINFSNNGPFLELNGVRLNSSNIPVSNFLVVRNLDSFGNEKLEVSFNLNSYNFKTVKYIQK